MTKTHLPLPIPYEVSSSQASLPLLVCVDETLKLHRNCFFKGTILTIDVAFLYAV